MSGRFSYDDDNKETNKTITTIKSAARVTGTLGKVVGFCYSTGPKVDPWLYLGMTGQHSRRAHRLTLVEFNLVNGTKQQLVCEPHEWKVQLLNGEVQASRKQVRPILALAFHRQGPGPDPGTSTR